MVIVDEEKCVGCARCEAFCPREALKAWGHVQIDTNKCTDCFGGLYHFDENLPLTNRGAILDKNRSRWIRSCIENCPVDALSVKEE